MTGEKPKSSFQKAWHIQVPGLKLLDFASDHHSFVTYDDQLILRLFNSQGQELWHRNPGQELVSISLADTLEILAVDNDKHSLLFGPEGATLWRKRPFPAAIGKISASGDSFAFVTSDPAIIGADRSLRVKWAYRNLMRRPAAIAVSALGQTTAFPCFDDRGEGLSAVNHNGKPYDAFMGLGTITDLELSEDGQAVIALTDSGKTFCLNLVKSFGIWKGDKGHKITGVSFASKTGEALLFSSAGQIIKLNPAGEQIWEHWFTDQLLKASITADGTGIFYATVRGEIGLLTQGGEGQHNQMTFQEIPVQPSTTGTNAAFRRVWATDLNGGLENHTELCIWKGQDGVEYSLVWDGSGKLFCLNDIGEEIWQERLSGDEVTAMSVSAEADLAIILLKNGVTGFDLSGGEVFRFFGQFTGAHVFDDGAILLLDQEQKVRYYPAFDNFSHVIETAGPIKALKPFASQAIVISDSGFGIFDSTGISLFERSFDSPISFIDGCCAGGYLVCGNENGLITIFDTNFETVFSYRLSEKIISLTYNRDQECVFAGTETGNIFVLQRRTGQMTRTSLNGKPLRIAGHEGGAIFATDMDQLALVNFSGQLLANYTMPFRLTRLLPSHRRFCITVLAEESVICLAAVDESKTTSG